MKKLLLFIVLIPCLKQAQDIIGKWNGILTVQGIELRLVFHISAGDSTYTAKLDSPDQKVFGIAASAPSFENATLTIEIVNLSADFINDVRASIAYLQTRKEIDKRRIRLIGHSEGGLIAPIVATDTKVAFFVLLAALGVLGSQILLKQAEPIKSSQGVDEENIQSQLILMGGSELFSQYGEAESFEARLKESLLDVLSTTHILSAGVAQEEFIAMKVHQFRRPWMRYFL